MNGRIILEKTRNFELIYLVFRGSSVFGLFNRKSDVDFLGVFFPDLPVLLGLEKMDQCEMKFEDGNAKYSGVLYDIRKYFLSLLKGSFPFLVSLFVPEDFILFSTSVGLELRGMRDLFLSRKCLRPILSYAKSEFEKFSKHKSLKGASSAMRILDMGKDIFQKRNIQVRSKERNKFYKKILDGRLSPMDIELGYKKRRLDLKIAAKASELPAQQNKPFLMNWLLKTLERNYI